MGRYRIRFNDNFVIMMVNYLFCFVLVVSMAEAVPIQDECKVTNCKHHEPPVKFPFRLQDRQPPHCGYPHPGFQLSCSENNQTVLNFPRSMKLLVKHIDYKEQQIRLYDPGHCLWKQLSDLNISAFPFRYEWLSYSRLQAFQPKPVDFYTLFNCSSKDEFLYRRYRIPCLSNTGSQIIAFGYDEQAYDENLLNCSKTGNISAAIYPYLTGPFQLLWDKPNCRNCEAQGRGCKLKSNSRQDQTECFDIPRHHRGARKRLIIAGVILGSFILATIVIGVGWAHRLKKREQESQLKIEKFLEDYRAVKPSRYSYADIKRITNHFKDKLGQGGYGTVFKGRLSNDVLVAVKVLNNFKGNGEEFINEVGSMGRIHHVNVTRLVGFCADGYERALVYEYLPNESLEKFIFSATGENRFLSWEKLQDIALGVAKGIEYLHQGCEQRILHFDIKPHNILLDQNFNPKISDFGLAKLCSKEQSAISMTTARGTMGYIAPEVLSRNFGNVSYKSDVYSFGMLLLEMVGGRKNIDVTAENTSQVYFPEWAYNRLDKGEELGIRIEDEEHTGIVKKLTIVGLWCIQWYPVDRPPMKVVVQMLEGEGSLLTVPPNPFASTDQSKMGANMPRKPVNRELPAIAELE
ncbi:Kinase superfamily protein, putative [Theobroma cacao]|uniref:Kinase superfamily protein, putative n=1 Tax=Theobroma cacao TaxID=3641 RepID=A0A061G286_THECC|nr:Kinase superfamily protein, putative [Theobroma cacao]